MRACDAILHDLTLEFAATTAQVAQTISGFGIAYGLMQFVFGPLGDRWGKLRIMTLAVLACALCNVAVALSEGLDALVWGRVLAGAAGGGIVPLCLAHIGDTVAYERRQMILSRLMTATLSGMIAGQWLGGLVAQYWGWRAVFWCLAALFMGVLPALWRAAQMQGAPAILLAVTLEGATGFAVFTFVPVLLSQRFGLSSGSAGAVAAVLGLGGLAYTLSARAIIARLGEGGMVRLGGWGIGVSLVAMGAVGQWQWAVPACALGGLSLYMLHNTLQAQATQMHPQMRGTALAVFASCLFLGTALGVTVASWLIDHDLMTAVFVGAGVFLHLLGTLLARELKGSGSTA
jgi:predicted MFS family arabinose efflux permease